MIVQIGEIYRTPFEPSGLVKVIEIERQQPGYPCATAFVEFIGDHPSGYKNGTNGRYFCDELRSTECYQTFDCNAGDHSDACPEGK